MKKENTTTMDSAGNVTEVWDAAQLMGKYVSFRGLPDCGETAFNGDGPPVSPRRFSKRASVKKVDKDTGIDKLMLWGQPGHLTQEESDIYVSCMPRSFLVSYLLSLFSL